MEKIRRTGALLAAAITATLALPSAASASSHPSRCHVRDLSVRIGHRQAGAGQRFATLSLRNRSRRTCTLYGYVGMQLLAADGGNVPTHVVRVRRGRRHTIRLQPGDHAFADMRWGAIPGPGEPTRGNCEPVAERIEVTPPDAFDQLVTRWRGGPVCEHGRIEVTPVRDSL